VQMGGLTINRGVSLATKRRLRTKSEATS
jgi:hypothetical protein